MIDAYTIGITLALNNGVSDGLAAIRQDLQALDRAVEASSLGLVHLRQLADTTVAGATADIARLMEATRQAAALLPRLSVGPAPEVSGHEQPPPPSPPRPEPVLHGVPAISSPWQPEAAARQPNTPAPPASSPLAPADPTRPPPGNVALPAAIQTTLALPSIPQLPLEAPPARSQPASQARLLPPSPPALQLPFEAPQRRRSAYREISDAGQSAAPSAPAERAVGRTPGSSAEHDQPPRSERQPASAEVPPVPPSIDYASVARILSPLALSPSKTAESVRPDLPHGSLSSASLGGGPAVESPSPPPPAVLSYRPVSTPPETNGPQGSRFPQMARSPDTEGGAAPTRSVVVPGPSSPSPASSPAAPSKPNPSLLSTGLPSAARQQTRADSMPTTVEVILDGAALGRWMDQRMAKASSRPPSGTTSFDPRVTPVWTTVPVGN